MNFHFNILKNYKTSLLLKFKNDFFTNFATEGSYDTEKNTFLEILSVRIIEDWNIFSPINFDIEMKSLESHKNVQIWKEIRIYNRFRIYYILSFQL